MQKQRFCFLIILFFLIIELSLFAHQEEANAMLRRITDALNIVLEKKFNQKDQKLLENIEILRKQLLLNTSENPGGVSIALTTKKQSIPSHPWGQILFSLVNAFHPNVILELGTCIGISGAYLLAGLESNNKGRLYTLETFDSFFPFITRHFKILGYDRYSLLGNLEELFKNLSSLPSIDIVFDDYIHKKESVLNNFDQIYPYLSNQALYIFDDIHINDSMTDAWSTLIQDKRINITISLTLGLAYPHRLHLGHIPRIGIGIVIKESKIKKHFDIVLQNIDANQNIAVLEIN